jgi:hypothetical protein
MASPSRSCFVDICYLRPSRSHSANGRTASGHLTPGHIDYGDGEAGEIETGHMGYFDTDELRP